MVFAAARINNDLPLMNPVERPAAEIQPQPPVTGGWFLTGPTASGKTKVAIELAQRLGAELISLDSMTLYRDMNIGTAKPTPLERQQVPHHLLDLVNPNEEFSLSEYVAAAHARLAEVRARGKEALFVGGTPLYLKALLRGVYQGPPADWEFRQQVEEELKSVDPEALHQRLQVIDPLAAAKLHPRDKRRIIRALEVFRLTGQPLSHQQTQFDEPLPAQQNRVFVLHWPRTELHRRIAQRVDEMFAAGLVDEVRGILARYGSLSRTALQAVGYREVIEFLNAGGKDLAAAKERVKARTRQFARRQETWFRSLHECIFVPQLGNSPAGVADEILLLAKPAR